MKNTVRTISIVVMLGVLLAGCAGQELRVMDAWARPGMQGGNTAIYFDVNNPTDEADTLLNARADVSAAVELHLSMMVSPEEAAAMGNGERMGNDSMGESDDQMGDDMVMVMQQQNSVAIPGDETTHFEPGGLHVMVIGLDETLEEGATIPLTLVFEKAGEISLDVPVRMP